MIRFCQDNRLRVPRPPPPGGIPGYGYESPFAQGGYGDRRGPAPGPPPFEGYVATPAVAGSDPYYGGGAPSYPARPAADPYAPRADPYAPPRDEPYGRPPAAATDPYARSDPYANRGAYGDAFGRPAYAPTPGGPAADPYARPGEGTWRDDRGPPQPAGYAPPTMAMEGYGYGEYGAQPSAGGGPMKREAAAPAWRAAEYERPVAEAPRGRERPGQRYVLKMRGVPFRAVETDVYEVGQALFCLGVLWRAGAGEGMDKKCWVHRKGDNEAHRGTYSYLSYQVVGLGIGGQKERTFGDIQYIKQQFLLVFRTHPPVPRRNRPRARRSSLWRGPRGVRVTEGLRRGPAQG